MLGATGAGFPTAAVAAETPTLFTISDTSQYLTAPIGSHASGEVTVTAIQPMLLTFAGSLPSQTDYSVTASGTCSATGTTLMQPGDTCVFSATLSPLAVIGPTFAGVTFDAVQATPEGAPATPALQERGSVSYCFHGNGIEVSSLDFGDVPVGEIRTGTVTLTNAHSDVEQWITSDYAIPGGQGFSLAEGTPRFIPVAPGQSQDIEVVFAPTEATEYLDSFVPIYTSMNNVGVLVDPYRVLRGVGVDPVIDPGTANLTATDPSSVTVKAGETAVFNSAPSADLGVNTVRWEMRASSSQEWSVVPGESGGLAQLELPRVPVEASGQQFRAVWTNDAYGETFTTQPATLTVTEDATVTPGGDTPGTTPPATGPVPNVPLAQSGSSAPWLGELGLPLGLLGAGAIVIALARVFGPRQS